MCARQSLVIGLIIRSIVIMVIGRIIVCDITTRIIENIEHTPYLSGRRLAVVLFVDDTSIQCTECPYLAIGD